MVCACEDVGLAYPQIIPIVKSCVDIAQAVGLPEARIPLADAVILVCNAPKSARITKTRDSIIFILTITRTTTPISSIFPT